MFESLFASEALRRGFDVSTPTAHHLPFDVIISNQEGKLYRVQVKGTGCLQGRGAYQFSCRRGNNTKRINYTKEIDVFVGIVELTGARVFYLIPSSGLTNVKSIKVRPAHDSRGKYEKFREDWSVFKK